MVKKNKLITASNFKDFDWNKAKLFYHIAKCGSFTKAARLADIDQSVLTRQIQNLETQVGCPLLVRKVGGVALTRKGEELLKKIAPFFQEMRGFCGISYVEMGEEKKRKIRISTSHALATYIINDLIIDYNKDNPHLIFEIIGDDDVLDLILNDVDIIIRPYDSETQNIQQELLFTLERKLYASQEYLEKHGEPKTVEELINHRLIAISSIAENYRYTDIHWILKLGMPDGKKHEPIFMANSIESMVQASKKGIGIVATYEAMSVLKKANLKNILSDVKDKKIHEYFTYPDYLAGDPDIINIKNYLQKELLKNQP